MASIERSRRHQNGDSGLTNPPTRASPANDGHLANFMSARVASFYNRDQDIFMPRLRLMEKR